MHHLTKREKKEQRQVHVCLDFPRVYGISLGEFKCNRICRMCPMYNIPPTKERYITDDVIEKSCHEVGERDLSLEISAYGETFLHPKADDYMFLIRKKCPKAHITIATNGSLLNQERCEKIVDSGINYLSFSLDAGSPESYKWLCQATDYEEVCRNLETLVAVRNRRGAKHLRITTHIIGIKELAHEFDPFIQRWSKITDGAWVRKYGNWAGIVDNNDVSPAEAQNIPQERYPCAWLWYSTKIEPNGDVSKCFIHILGEKTPLGNILQQSFESIWQGPRIKQLREWHQTGQFDKAEYCPNCICWSLFPKFWEKKRMKWWCKKKWV